MNASTIHKRSTSTRVEELSSVMPLKDGIQDLNSISYSLWPPRSSRGEIVFVIFAEGVL
jgi:hypothetical protein